MNGKFAKGKLAFHICLALAAGTLAAGCASNGNKKTQTVDIDNPATVAKSSMSNSTVAPEAKSNEVITARSEARQDEITQITENQAAGNQSPALESFEQSAAAEITYPAIDIQEQVKPEQLSFQFGFDKAELSETDKEVVIQHAHFLRDNPEVIVKIQGHTDHHGPKEYNEYLSKKRAEAVAMIMLGEGVQESQLEIVALADEAPLIDVEDTKMNRRVELKYGDFNLVQND
ncbi:MAG: OmpA family protein [Thioalkalispiraceae bacterium]|jgi:peptidoglycan-associated lipoprotein